MMDERRTPAAPQRVVIKVCGITEERDAIEAALLGVDALGFHFSRESPCYIRPEAARRITERLPAFVARVGVFADEPLIWVLEVARSVGLTAVQLHGSEDPSYCAALEPFAWYKTVRLGGGSASGAFDGYACTTFLLDLPTGAGRDRIADLRRARALSIHGRILLSGALHPGNVAEAVEVARPYGVNATSGVEIAPGKKNLDRLEEFVCAVREAERRLGA